MRVVFRVDSSTKIGTGHVMRCLTLAEALRQRGATCGFICRDHPGNLNKLIAQRGFCVHALPYDPGWKSSAVHSVYAEWLGAEWEVDAEQTKVGASGAAIDWLIVDHYALDARWESSLTSICGKLMVIDDLADRLHTCDLLLDQTFGREVAEYRPLVPDHCRLLCGSRYALLRPEFAAMRPYSLRRRDRPCLRDLLITMGGVDKDNATRLVLQALSSCSLPVECRITVVLGETAPWLDDVSKVARNMPWPTQVLVGVGDMALLMADSDLAIGAAGATSWERCCLGLPTIMIVLAENQRKIAEVLYEAGAVQLVDIAMLEHKSFIFPKYLSSRSLRAMSAAGAEITNGLGVADVVESLIEKLEHAN